MAEVAGVVERAAEDTDEDEQEGLQRADPRDLARRLRLEYRGLVVGLEDAEGVGQAPRFAWCIWSVFGFGEGKLGRQAGHTRY